MIEATAFAFTVLIYVLAGLLTCKAWWLAFGSDEGWGWPDAVTIIRFLLWPLAAVIVLSSNAKK